MRKFFRLFTVVLVIVQIWTVSTQPTDGNNKLLNKSENKENSLSVILSEIQQIQLNTANIELKLKESDEIIAKQNAELENKLRLLNTEIDELLKTKEQVADYKDQVTKLQSTINIKNEEISKLKSEKEEDYLEITMLKSAAEKQNSEIEMLKNEQKENQEQMVRKSFIEMELERCKYDTMDSQHKLADLEKTLSTLQTQLKYCHSWKEFFKNKLSSKDDALNDCFTKHQQISGSSIPSRILPTSCLNLTSGIQEIQLPNGNSYYVLCGSDGWMIIQRRIDGSGDFNKNLQIYVDGIGDINGEFFMGLENLHLITNATRHKLKVYIEKKEEEQEEKEVILEYDDFRIGNSESLYELESIGNFTGEIDLNALEDHVKMPFSITDVNSNNWETMNAGWWFSDYNQCDLNAPYDVIYWRWLKIQRVTMEIRPYTDEY